MGHVGEWWDQFRNFFIFANYFLWDIQRSWQQNIALNENADVLVGIIAVGSSTAIIEMSAKLPELKIYTPRCDVGFCLVNYDEFCIIA